MHYEEGYCCDFAYASKIASFEEILRSEVVDSDATITGVLPQGLRCNNAGNHENSLNKT